MASLVGWLRRQPRWVLVAIGLLWVAALAAIDYFAPLEVSFLTLYVAPVLFLVWFVGRGAGFLGAAFAILFWGWEDVFSANVPRTESLHITNWNLAVRAVFLVLFAWVVAELKRSLEREHRATRARLERDVEIAHEVQTRLFPRRDPEIPRLECHGVCLPAQGVSGDYYDFLPLAAGRTGIAVGDVAGKGLPAALLMASVQGSLRSLATLSERSPATVAAELNAQLHALTESNRFATFFWAVFDEKGSTLTWVNAGHNAPMLLRVSGDVERLRPSGPPLGAFPSAAYTQATTALSRGDLLVVFTDGVTEAVDTDEQEFGEARLERLLRENGGESVGALCDRIVETVRAFEAGAPQNDDITLVVARAR